MGFENELIVIKQYQRDFLAKFGKKLPVDFATLKGIMIKSQKGDEVIEDALECLDECVKETGANLEVILSGKKLNHSNYSKEKAALSAFARKVVANGWNMRVCGELVNRNRVVLNQYSHL